jgi:hypothetical protein
MMVVKPERVNCRTMPVRCVAKIVWQLMDINACGCMQCSLLVDRNVSAVATPIGKHAEHRQERALARQNSKVAFDSRARAATRGDRSCDDFAGGLGRTRLFGSADLGGGDRHRCLAGLRQVRDVNRWAPVHAVGPIAVYVADQPCIDRTHCIGGASGRAGQRCSCTRSLNQLQQSGIPVPGWIARAPVAGEYLEAWWRSSPATQVQVEWLRGVNAEHITAWTSTLGRRAAASAVSFVATLIALFLVLRDGRMPADHALTVAGSSPGERLARKIADAIRATVNGTVATGGAWLMAAGLAGVGTAVLLENVILPALNGEAARIPFVLVLVGIIGGIGSVRIARSFPRPRDNGGPADHMARVDWYRRVIISDHQIVSLS